MPNPKNNNECLTEEEVAKLLEPIRDWEHSWGAIAQKIIEDEIERRTRVKESKKLGPYGDWPVDGH